MIIRGACNLGDIQDSAIDAVNIKLDRSFLINHIKTGLFFYSYQYLFTEFVDKFLIPLLINPYQPSSQGISQNRVLVICCH